MRRSLVIAVLWERFALARRGKATAEEVKEALAAVQGSGVEQRAFARRLLEQVTAWLARGTGPIAR